MQDFQTQVPWPRKEVTYSSLASTSKTLALATNQIAAAIRSHKTADIVVGVAMGRSSATELLSATSALAWNADTAEDRDRLISFPDRLDVIYFQWYGKFILTHTVHV